MRPDTIRTEEFSLLVLPIEPIFDLTDHLVSIIVANSTFFTISISFPLVEFSFAIIFTSSNCPKK